MLKIDTGKYAFTDSAVYIHNGIEKKFSIQVSHEDADYIYNMQDFDQESIKRKDAKELLEKLANIVLGDKKEEIQKELSKRVYENLVGRATVYVIGMMQYKEKQQWGSEIPQ